MTTHQERQPIVVEQKRRRTRVTASGAAAVRILDALAEGAPSFEAAAFRAWIEADFPIPDALKARATT